LYVVARLDVARRNQPEEHPLRAAEKPDVFLDKLMGVYNNVQGVIKV
jgi:hypothetical protein